MKKIKKTKFKKPIRCILQAHNGFSQRIVMEAKNLPLRINLPFYYQVRISDPIIGDHIDVEANPTGEFVLQKRTKATAIYQLENLYHVHPRRRI